MLEHGIGKSSKEELDELLETLDDEYSAKVKRLFNKALIECLKNASSGQTFVCSRCDAIKDSVTEPAKKK